MRVGISCFLTDKSVSIVELAREVEARGFGELWLPEHTHIPTSRNTAWPIEDDAELPEMYKRSLDPFVALTAAAMVTDTITVGTSICLVGQHDPIVLAKTVATLDHIAGGRLILGVGFGWNIDEMRHHGVDPARRRAIGWEKVLAMKELWTQDEASFHAEFVDFSASWQWPKPIQQPHPPIWVGGGRSTMRHAVEWGDGWMPIEGVMPVAKMTRDIRAMAAAAGRDPAELTVYLAGAQRDPAEFSERYLR
jgi:probable F420-dependent oxidoreductase